MPEELPNASELLLQRQQAFLLHQLATAPDGTLTQSAANKAIPKQIRNELNFPGTKRPSDDAADGIRTKMLLAGWLTGVEVKKKVTYTISDPGKKQLIDWERYIPLFPVKGEVQPPADDRVRATREAIVLFALAREDRSTTKADVAEISKRYGLELNPATARSVLTELILRGDVLVHRSDGTESFTITESGKRQLSDRNQFLPLLPAGGKLNLPENESSQIAREVYILQALYNAPNKTISNVDLKVGFGGKGMPKAAELVAKHPHLVLFRDQSCLGLNPATTRAVLTELAHRGDILVHRTAESESYSLTPKGAALLGNLRSECPVLPPLGKPSPAQNESVRRGREAFVLIKLLQSAKYSLWESDAANGSYPKPLKLNHATAWQVRGELTRAGHIAVQWDGKEGSYTLTQLGKKYLTTLPFDVLGEVKLKGSALTELLAAAREGTKSFEVEKQSSQPVLTDAQLEAAVMEIFHELLAGQYANLRMVPIYEIREQVAERFGRHVASHPAFNEVLLDMRRTDKVRLISIDDRSRAMPDQLRDSIFAVGETFFYVEKANAIAQGG